MSSEADLYKRIAQDPNDLQQWLVLADWLEERGDKACIDVRRQVALRLPRRAEELAYLQHISAARDAADLPVVLDEELLDGGLERIARACADPRSIAVDKIARNFPRDNDGRPRLKCVVLLAGLNSQRWSLKRTDWLAAVGPTRRRDPQQISVRIGRYIGRNHQHDWSNSRWLWSDADFAPEEPDADRVRFGNRPECSPRILQDRMVAATLLQDQVRFDQALALFDVKLDRDVREILNCVPAYGKVNKKSRSSYLRDYGERWLACLRHELWTVAPWKLAAAFDPVLQNARWKKTPRQLILRLMGLPGQTWQSKRSLMLVADVAGPTRVRNIQFKLASTASNDRYPEIAWKRSLDLDIARARHLWQ